MFDVVSPITNAQRRLRRNLLLMKNTSCTHLICCEIDFRKQKSTFLRHKYIIFCRFVPKIWYHRFTFCMCTLNTILSLAIESNNCEQQSTMWRNISHVSSIPGSSIGLSMCNIKESAQYYFTLIISCVVLHTLFQTCLYYLLFRSLRLNLS